MLTLYVGEDNLIEWNSMQDSADDTYVNDATVTANVKDTSGNVITNGGPLTLSFVAGSNGKYQGVLPNNAALVRGTQYYLEVDAASTGRDGKRHIPCVAAHHGAQ